MLSFAAITPHPPIIIPGIGSDTDLKQVSDTIASMEILRQQLEIIEPDTILLISPHAPINDPNAFGINESEHLTGDLKQVGLERSFTFLNDLILTNNIKGLSPSKQINIISHQGSLDHGSLVPLYFLTKNIKPKLVVCSLSFLDSAAHYTYGELIGNVIDECDKKIAVIASGNLSHRLSWDAPKEYSPQGKIFDDQLINLLKHNVIEDIINIDADLVEEAQECGLRSFLILLGILNGKNFKVDALSYEGPFGVGYLTAQIII